MTGPLTDTLSRDTSSEGCAMELPPQSQPDSVEAWIECLRYGVGCWTQPRFWVAFSFCLQG